MVCPHSVIRAKIYDEKYLKGAPKTFKSTEARGKEWSEKSRYTLQVAPEDCTGCDLCVEVCPAKNKQKVGLKAINMKPQIHLRKSERENWEYFLKIPEVDRTQLKVDTVKGSQFLEPLFEFSGASDWIIDDENAYHGFYSARSGDIVDDQTTSLIVSMDVIEEGEISFFRKVSCENADNNNYDFLVFYINGAERGRWDGITDWNEESFSVDPGYYTFEWKYSKDSSVSSGEDCAWIDYALSLVHKGLKNRTNTPQEWFLAEEALLRAISLGNHQAFYHLGCLYSLMGNFSEAIQALEQCLHHQCLPSLHDIKQDKWRSLKDRNEDVEAYAKQLAVIHTEQLKAVEKALENRKKTNEP